MNQRTHSWIAIRAIALLEDEKEERNLVRLLKPLGDANRQLPVCPVLAPFLANWFGAKTETWWLLQGRSCSASKTIVIGRQIV